MATKQPAVRLVEKTEAKSARSAIVALRDEVRKTVYELDEVVDLSVVALLGRVHLCLLGKPGAAKSKVTTEITKRITGSKIFIRLLTKTSTPEELFGPIMLSGLRNDRYVRNTQGYLPEAHVGFADEVFKANSAILNSLLTLMNEREFDNDGKRSKCPLITLFGASNELPQEEGLNAMWDRFVLRTVVDYMADEGSYKALFASRATQASMPAPTAFVALETLQAAQEEVAKVALPDTVVERLLVLRRELMKAKVEVSPRRWSDSIPVLQARAWLSGRDTIVEDDLLVLEHVLWANMEQRTAVRKVVNQVINPEREQALALYDTASSAWREFEALPAEQQSARAGEFGPKIRGAGEKLKALVNKLTESDRPVGDLPAKLEVLRSWHKQMVEKLMG